MKIIIYKNESSRKGAFSQRRFIQMKAVVDRIEGQIAIVLFGDDEIKADIPLVLLPEGTKEGSHRCV